MAIALSFTLLMLRLALTLFVELPAYVHTKYSEKNSAAKQELKLADAELEENLDKRPPQDQQFVTANELTGPHAALEPTGDKTPIDQSRAKNNDKSSSATKTPAQ